MKSFARIGLSAAMVISCVGGLLGTAPAQTPPGESDALAKAMKLPPMGLQSDFAAIEAQWKEIDREVALGEKHLQTRVGTVSHWSLGQQTMHIARTINVLVEQMFDPILANPTVNANEAPKPIGKQVLTGGAIPRGAGKAPAAVAIHFQPTYDQIKAEVKKAKESWARVASRKAEVEKNTGKMPHFALGPMTATDWVRFTAIHTQHHLGIIRDIEAATSKSTPK